jgi:hypothetical protein
VSIDISGACRTLLDSTGGYLTDDLEHLRGSLAQLAEETRRRQGGTHPRPEALIAHSAGELEPAAAEAILDHLSVCRPCARLVLGIPAFLEAPAPGARQAAYDPETNASWEALWARLRQGPTLPFARAVRADERERRHQPHLALLALAAALAGCLIGFPIWIATHGRSPVPPPIVSINPTERTLGETPSPGTFPATLRLNAEAAALVLYLPAPQPYPRFRVEILDRRGRTASPANAAPISQQAILVILTHEQIPPGEYRLRVFGVDSRRQQPLGEYPLRIVAR